MSGMSKRSFAVFVGSVICAQQLLAMRPATAAGYTVAKQQCTRWGGTPEPLRGKDKKENPGKNYRCDTPERDAACGRQLGKTMAIFDIDDGKCFGCFLTTACVEHLGFDDDCFELSSLRRFRDGFLRHREEGPAVIDRYYDVAPRIVRAIHAADDRNRELTRLYAVYILPTAVLARLGANRAAYWVYRRMMIKLERQYVI